MKNTLMILVVGALFGTMLVGCGSSTEGNNTPEATPAATTGATAEGMKKTEEGTPAANTPAATTPEANAPAANTPAPDANAGK